MISGSAVLHSQNIVLPQGMWWQADSRTLSVKRKDPGDEKIWMRIG
jgi:hypothetical protein